MMGDEEKPTGAGAQWDARFGSTEEHLYGVEPNEFLAAVAPRIPPGSRVLSLGEGEGRNAVHLASLGHRVTAVDASSVGLAKARRLADARGVSIETVVTHLSDYAIEPGAWDAIVVIFCHLPPGLREQVHRQVVRGLRPGGLLLLEAYTPEQLRFRTGGPPVRNLLYSAEMLRRDFAGLDFELLQEVERDVIEGRLHTGRASVVQAIAVAPA